MGIPGRVGEEAVNKIGTAFSERSLQSLRIIRQEAEVWNLHSSCETNGRKRWDLLRKALQQRLQEAFMRTAYQVDEQENKTESQTDLCRTESESHPSRNVVQCFK